jgi:hypothetical protein
MPVAATTGSGRVQVVVARYREDLSWLEEFGLPARVYDKSGEPGPDALPNIGREAHTYFWHLAYTYPDFPEYTVFLQGSPLAHLEWGAVAELQKLVNDAVRSGTGFKGLARYRLRCDGLGRPHDMRDPEKQGRWAGWGKDIPVAEVYGKLFKGKAPETFIARGAAGLFLVHRERILVRPREFYLLGLALTEADPQDENNTGHALERLWQIVFNGSPAINRDDYAEQVAALQARRGR